jgi:general secretion pathway protein D
MRPIRGGLRVALAAVLTIGASGAAHAQVQATPEGVQLNLQGVGLQAAVTALADAAGINLVTANLPEVTVTLRTAAPVPLDQVRPLLISLAVAQGVTATESDGFLRLQGPLDEDDLRPARNLYAYRLDHARAAIIAVTLQSLFGGPSTPIPNVTTSSGSLSQQLGQLQGQAQQSFFGGGQQQIPQNITITDGADLEGAVIIVPEVTTNTLMVRATENDWGLIQQAILSLDLRPLQVAIEVVIAEVRRTEELDVGTSFGITANDGTATLPGGGGDGDFAIQLGVSRDDVDIDATLSALAADGSVRILSRPVVMAQNNQEAQIVVGDQRPFVQATLTTPNDQAVQNEIIQYRNVGTVLTILPTINEDGYVNLLLTQEVSSATSEREFGAPVISTREVFTQLLARSGQTVAIGGLVDRQLEESRSGIPLLKDIPVLGYFFGRTSERVSNSELFLFVTPYVIASDADADRLRDVLDGGRELTEGMDPLNTLLPPVTLPDTLLPVNRVDTILTADTLAVDTLAVDTLVGRVSPGDGLPLWTPAIRRTPTPGR